MAGLNFYTQTIINSNVDPDSGKPLFTSGDSYVKILRDFLFYKDKAGYGKTLRVAYKQGHTYKLCKATIDFKKLLESLKDSNNNVPETLCRLDVNLGIEGAEPFIYSTPWVLKGKPFWIEFTIPACNVASDATTEAEKLVKKLKDDIKRIHMFQCDKDLVNVSVSTKDLVFEGANEYQRFKNIEVVAYDPKKDAEKSLAKLGEDGSAITLNMRGCNSFGTYSLIVKDLRVPTAANWQPNHIRLVETPIVGATYDQFIVEYEAPATNEGLGCVGLRMNSVTTHVFWVKNDVADTFKTAVAKLVTKVEGTAAFAEYNADSAPAGTAMESDSLVDDKAKKAE